MNGAQGLRAEGTKINFLYRLLAAAVAAESLEETEREVPVVSYAIACRKLSGAQVEGSAKILNCRQSNHTIPLIVCMRKINGVKSLLL